MEQENIFNNGDYVKIINTNGEEALNIGDIGIIRENRIRFNRIGVEFKNENSYRHNLNGLINKKSGYYCKLESLEKISKEEITKMCCFCNCKKENTTKINDLKYICKECKKEAIICEDCGELFLKNNTTKINIHGEEKTICKNCLNNKYFCCDYCGDYEYIENILITRNGEKICGGCSDNYCVVCSNCHNLVEESEAIIFDDEYYCCEDCTPLLNEYSYKPNPIFHGNSKYFYGFELEVENSNRNKLMLHIYKNDNLKELLYFKEDSSLSSSKGVEIVSHPFDYKYLKNNIYIFKDLFNILNEENTSTNSRTGLHFHISREAFGEDRKGQNNNINKFILFIEYYSELVKKLSRREDYYYCEFLTDTFKEEYTNNKKCFLNTLNIEKKKNTKGHYQNINLNNTNTIEIRFFQSTTNFEYFIGAIEFIESLINVIKNKKISDISFSDVVNYNGNDYLKSNCKELNVNYTDEKMKDYKILYYKHLSDIKKKKNKIIIISKDILVKIYNKLYLSCKDINTENLRNNYIMYRIQVALRKINVIDENNISGLKNIVYSLIYSITSELSTSCFNEDQKNIMETLNKLDNDIKELLEMEG